MSSTEQKKDEVFSLAQKFLSDPPVIIWGSGATIPYGLPSMDDLKKALRPHIVELNGDANLEVALGNIDDENKINEIREVIRNEVLKKDIACLKSSIQNPHYLKPTIRMINKFYNAHPQKIDIVTSNYDRVLEYALSQGGYSYTDGFTGKPLSKFEKSSFGNSKIINLIKVHGSLNWVSYSNDPFFLPCEYETNGLKYVMILPSKNKYKDVIDEPYRTLITKSDEAIEAAQSFLVIGFGFNDEHLTPKIESQIKNGVPVVIITKTATSSCKTKLNEASNYCLFEKIDSGTKVTFKKQADLQEQVSFIDKNYWELSQFMEILGQ